MFPKEWHKPKITSFAKICRICLRQAKYLRSIYKAKLLKMLEYCATIQVLDNDNMPENVCFACSRLIMLLYRFKLRIKKSDKILRNCLEKDYGSLQQNIETNTFLIEETPKKHIPLSDIEAEDIKFQDIHIDEFVKFENLATRKTVPNAQIFSDSPPPLVPLDPSDFTGTLNTSNMPTLDLLEATPPPLVPIKAQATMEINILNDMTDKSELTFSCTSCHEPFSSITELRQHKLTVCHPKALECNVCRKEFQERRKLIGHLKGHMVARNYKCKICGKQYPNPSTFKVHMRTHTGERPFKCQICGKGFMKWAAVVNHMKTHKPDKPFECKTCGRRFKVAFNLERHKVLHNDVLPFCCNFCGRTFSQSENLQLHIRTNHTNDRPHLCSECGKRFVSSTRLNRHMWTHNGYKPYICHLCPKSYTNTNDLKLHQRNHLEDKGEAEKQYACPACGMKFFHKCRLARHMKTHDKPFNCDVCMKGFKLSKSLKKHQKTHGVKQDEQPVYEPVYICIPESPV